MMQAPSGTFFMAGFECSSQVRTDGVRLDLIRATGHDRHVLADYRRCADFGLVAIRDGLRWHRIETAPGVYDWSNWQSMLEAGEAAGVRIIWDIFHYGSPDGLDQSAPEFIERYAAFAAEAVRHHRIATGKAPLVCPMNEISFLSWAVEVGYFPFTGPRELGWFKRHLIQASIAGIKAMRGVDRECRFIWAEPLIHVAPKNHERKEMRAAEQFRSGQFEVYDMLVGRARPELGGEPSFVDLIGLNYYPHNQWYLNGPTIPMGHHEYRALAEMLVEVSERYEKPIYISETGSEGSGRPAWLHYVCDEVRDAQRRGADMRGICLYPITAYPGWDNSRHAEAGLFSTIGADGERHPYAPLADELRRQQALFEAGTASPVPLG
jgi:beta-glucosidase/6-phospho-beta-glucosidase/beta-galactosidase